MNDGPPNVEYVTIAPECYNYRREKGHEGEYEEQLIRKEPLDL